MTGPVTREMQFDFGDKVFMDGDRSIALTVTGVRHYPHLVVYQLSYFANGQYYEHWIDDWRITAS